MTRALLLFALMLIPAAGAAQDKTLYKCRAADGSLSFQETACDGTPLQVIPIAPDKNAAADSTSVAFNDAGCRDLALVIWKLDGATATFDVSADARKELSQRRATLRERCALVLDPSPLAVDCALLAEALRLRRADASAINDDAHARIGTQHAERCSDAAVRADLDRGLRRVEPVR